LYTLLKSEVGPFPEPAFPQGIDLAAEDRKARRRLYPVTIIYGAQLVTLLALARASGHGLRALAFLLAGLSAWSPVEYLAHRFVLHGVFPAGASRLRRVLHYLFDASHADHHARPWDGMYINGHLDTLLVAAVAEPLSFTAPHWTASVFVAGLLAAYAFEEWLHHALHFWSFHSRYFQYVRRRHLWHHSRRGAFTAYGITSGFWDVAFDTRIPERERALLKWRPPPSPRAGAASA
jgi:sterol desaturase/sphingolipid hydroxylase (fatty acid hydroxylase superfamily)